MSENRTESPLRTLGRRLVVGVDRVVDLPGRALVGLANLGQRAANAGVVPALLATLVGIWLAVCWRAAAGDLP